MVVSQYIYTACGKERTGAFSVFSKSKDITEDESAEIREVMMYKAPPGLPYEPTEQQIEELWPKKFGYFLLSSGRACLANVTYVGRVYSDQDGRSGNYIIHAFVFNKTESLSPYSFIEHEKFKRLLTKKEWHDDPIPDSLPQIEIPDNGGMITSGEMSSFFNEDRKKKLMLLIEAIGGSSAEKPVCFADDPKNLKLWFKILSVCLPKGMQNSMSVCTHFTNNLVPGNASSRIQMRVNQPDGYQFSYAQEAQKGSYAFDFVKNIAPEAVKPGKFAEAVVKALSTSAFEAVKVVDAINTVMSSYSVTLNEAPVLLSINKTDYSDFANGSEIYNAILLADSKGYETQSIAKNLWSKWTQLGFTKQQGLGVLAFMYKNIPAMDIKVKIIQVVVESADKFDIRTDGAAAYRDDLNAKAKFIFANYLDYLKAQGLANYVTNNQGSFNKLFLAFDTLVLQAAKNSSSEEMTLVKNILASAFKRQSLADIDLLVNSANARSSGLGVNLLTVIVKSPIASGSGIGVKFAFDILQRVSEKADVAYAYLLTLIKTMSNQDGFVKEYTDAQNKNPDFYKKFEADNEKDAVVIDFCKKKDMYRFMNQPMSFSLLENFFKKYYIKGEDAGVFNKSLGKYLNGVQPEKRLGECTKVLESMKPTVKVDPKIMPPMYCAVLEAIFSVPYAKILDACKKKSWLEKLEEMYDAVTDAREKVKQETLELVIITLCGQALEKNGFQGSDPAAIKDLAAQFDTVDSAKSIDVFVEYYFQPVVNVLIVWAGDSKQFKPSGEAEKIFAKIIDKGTLENLTRQIVEGIRKSKANAFPVIAYLFRKLLASSSNKLDKKLGEIAEDYFIRYLEKKGDRKRNFDELLKLAAEDEKEPFQKYFDEFNKKHKPKGLFGF